MLRQALKGIGQVIRANTTEKSIDELRAEGKKRVRVVSSERVMAIIQAIVDDTIEAEVGEIARRDRDRIVSDTQERFSRVLKMQQDLEQDVDDLRGALRGAESERDRLRADKSLLETQLDVARRADGDSDTVARLARDLARVRDSVERTSQANGSAAVDAALGRVAEEIAERDAHAARRLGAELDDLRERLAVVGREATQARDAAIVTVLEHVERQQVRAYAPLAAQLDRALGTVAGQIADLGASLDGSVCGLRGELAAAAERAAVEGTAPRGAAEATEVTEALAELRSQTAASAARSSQAQAALAARLDDSLSALLGALGALSARSDDAAERQLEAVRLLGDQIARGAPAESDALHASFKSALDQALDKITRTMQAATARPIEMSGEATDALLGKIFDDPDSELTSNFDQLDVKERRSGGSIAKSVDRLRQMAGLVKAGAGKPE